MTQAYNLTLFANNADTSGKVSNSSLTGVLPIANGGTNNASLGVTAGGIVYTDGSKLANTGAGTSGQYLISNAASAPAWGNLNSSTLVSLSSTSFSAVSTTTVSSLTLTAYTFVWILFQITPSSTPTLSIGSSTSAVALTATSWGGSMLMDLNTGIQNSFTTRATTGSSYIGISIVNFTGYSKSSTSITMSCNTGTMTGTWQIWGMK